MKCCLARLTTTVLNKMPGFWSCLVFFDRRAVSPKQNANCYAGFITWPLHMVLSTVPVSSSFLPSQRMHCLGVLPAETWIFLNNLESKRREGVPFLAVNPQATSGSVVFCLAFSLPQRDCKPNSSISYPLIF